MRSSSAKYTGCCVPAVGSSSPRPTPPCRSRAIRGTCANIRPVSCANCSASSQRSKCWASPATTRSWPTTSRTAGAWSGWPAWIFSTSSTVCRGACSRFPMTSSTASTAANCSRRTPNWLPPSLWTTIGSDPSATRASTFSI